MKPSRVQGRWTCGVGKFFCEDSVNGHPVRVRFEWTNPGPSAARWEQAFPYDSGMSWDVNWIMELTRAE